MRKSWIGITLSYFFITATAGVLMRLAAIAPLPAINYEHILHAHSHLAILGWGYMSLFLLFAANFLDSEDRRNKQLTVLYWLTQLTVAGMFVSFSLQGYALFSIGFSTLHIFLSYWFAAFVWRRLRRQSGNQDHNGHSGHNSRKPVSHAFAKASLVCMAVSSLGPWLLAVLSANHLNGSAAYDAAIYFYLHFQYNGWFTLGLIAVLLRYLEARNAAYPERLARWLYGLYVWSLPPSFLMSMLWLYPDMYWTAAAAAGTLLHMAAVLLLAKLVHRMRTAVRSLFAGWAIILFRLSFASLLLKAAMELGAVVPGLSGMVYESRSIVIGYLHLALLGFVSFLLLAFFMKEAWLGQRRAAERAGYALFLTGFAANELTLFAQGLMDWIHVSGLVYGRAVLAAASIGMAVGILMFWIKRPETHGAY